MYITYIMYMIHIHVHTYFPILYVCWRLVDDVLGLRVDLPGDGPPDSAVHALHEPHEPLVYYVSVSVSCQFIVCYVIV